MIPRDLLEWIEFWNRTRLSITHLEIFITIHFREAISTHHPIVFHWNGTTRIFLLFSKWVVFENFVEVLLNFDYGWINMPQFRLSFVYGIPHRYLRLYGVDYSLRLDWLDFLVWPNVVNLFKWKLLLWLDHLFFTFGVLDARGATISSHDLTKLNLLTFPQLFLILLSGLI